MPKQPLDEEESKGKWKTVLLSVFLALFFCLGMAAWYVNKQPDDFTISRKISMEVPADRIFDHVGDFHKWQDWSPWAKLDPNQATAFEGPENGYGSIMAWSGNNQVGEGRMMITESKPPDHVFYQLDMTKPIQASNRVEFHFVNKGTYTEVYWTMYGKRNFVMKAMNIVFNCDEMVGKQFEQGLQSLKELVVK